MATYHPRRFSRPETLRALGPGCLERLLEPHAAYLARRGVTLPMAGREAPLKYQALAQLFIAPDRDMPQEMIDALYIIDELSTPSGMEALETAAKGIGVTILHCFDVTPADVALQLWIEHRPLVERVQAEMAIRRFRAFEYLQPAVDEAPPLPEALASKVPAIEAELNECFHSRHRGRYSRILLDEQEDCVWWYVAHGGLLRREGTVAETGPSSICYRPELYDAVVFVRAGPAASWGSTPAALGRRTSTGDCSASTCSATNSSSPADRSTRSSRCDSMGGRP